MLSFLKRPVTAVLVVGLMAFTAGTAKADTELSSELYEQLDLFGRVLERVRADYVDDVSDEELMEAAINGLLTSLDPHSGYLSPKGYQEMQVQTRGEFGGLGIEVTMENGLVKVVSPIDGTPAFRAGIQAGDLISHLDEEQVLGLTLTEAVERMRGRVGTDIKLTIQREGAAAPFDVTITRDKITIVPVDHRLEAGNVGYIRLRTFSEQTQSGLETAIDRIEREAGDDLIGFVIDLRNNPGGLLDQAIQVTDSFLEQGEIVSTRGRRADGAQRYNASEGDLAEGRPIVVLINGGSASASEIVAGALQDHRRAIVVGTKSFGKGSVQTIVQLPGHGAMRLTTARYYTPSGRSIQATGIEPDIEVRPARIEEIAAISGRREENLRGALPNPDGGDGETETEENTAPPGASQGPDGDEEAAEGETDSDQPVDYQLARAIDLLQGVHLFNRRVVN